MVSLALEKHGTSRNRVKQGRRQTSRLRIRPFTLSVIWYGPMDKFDDIGEFFLQCSEYLQSPLHCDRNVPYRNPQSLSGRDENPSMTFDLREKLTFSEFETLAQGVDLSANLQTGITFPETEPPAAIRTPLYRQVDASEHIFNLIMQSPEPLLTSSSHQKQALTFMLMREKDSNEIWKAVFNDTNGMTRYVHRLLTE